MFDQYICHDEFSGRYFVSNLGTIQVAAAQAQVQAVTQGWTSLNDFYDFVGLDPIAIGHDLGWSSERNENVDVRFSAILTPGGTPALAFRFPTPPKPAPSSHSEGGRHV